jgi:hypothetical protein
LTLAASVLEKLSKKNPPVTQVEIEEAFAHYEGDFLIDTREKNRTDPPTHWFIGETVDERLLKICFIPLTSQKLLVIKTAYDPDSDEVDFFRRNL